MSTNFRICETSKPAYHWLDMSYVNNILKKIHPMQSYCTSPLKVCRFVLQVLNHSCILKKCFSGACYFPVFTGEGTPRKKEFFKSSAFCMAIAWFSGNLATAWSAIVSQQCVDPGYTASLGRTPVSGVLHLHQAALNKHGFFVQTWNSL